jgi:hypothetical protein
VQDTTTYVGMDVHKESIFVAMLRPGQPALEWQQAHDDAAVRRLLRKLQREAPGPLACCYEAGPCGYGLQRQLTAAGLECHVVAPSLIPGGRAGVPGSRQDRASARAIAPPPRSDHQSGQSPRATSAGRSGVALSAPTGRRCGPAQAAPRPTESDHRARRQGAAPLAPALLEIAGGAEAAESRRHRGGARASDSSGPRSNPRRPTARRSWPGEHPGSGIEGGRCPGTIRKTRVRALRQEPRLAPDSRF